MQEVYFDIEKVGIKIPPGFEYQNSYMPTRKNSEPLTRLTLNRALNLSKKRLGALAYGLTTEVIDLGAWIGDNALPMAKIHPDSKVIAIDPSDENLEYIKTCATLNNIGNIKCIEALVGEKVGETYFPDGDIRHSSFSHCKAEDMEQSRLSISLDSLFKRNIINPSVIHLDTEGMELSILKGSLNLLKQRSPVVIFESHLYSDPLNETLKLLSGERYCVFIINERLNGCRPDCRNMLAVPIASTTLNRLSSELVRDIVDSPNLAHTRKVCKFSKNLIRLT